MKRNYLERLLGKRISVFLTFIILVVSFFIAVELILTLVYHFTHSPSLMTTKVANPYPKKPEDYLKIAIFGGSAAAGYNSERGFDDILDYELKKRYPGLKFYIWNYAYTGQPFHRHQAEALKSVLSKYDIFLIFAGNNEIVNYFDDTGYFRIAKYKDKKRLTPFKKENTEGGIRSFLKAHSRIYAIWKRFYNRLQNKLSRIRKRLGFDINIENIYHFERFNEFQEKKVMLEEEYAKIYSNFENDLDEIAKLSRQLGKTVIISSVPANESYRPFFSVCNSRLTREEKIIFWENYELGLNLYKNQEFKKALLYLLLADKADDHVAIVKHMLGHSYLALGDIKRASKFLRQSIDDSGCPLNALSALFEIEKKISQKYNNMYFIDTVETFYILLGKGIIYRKLFSDTHHPSFFGHIIIANKFLTKMSEIEPLKSVHSKQGPFDFNSVDFTSLLEYYKEKLQVTDKDEFLNAISIVTWNLGLSALSAYPEDFLDVARENLLKFYEKSAKDENIKVHMLVYSALIEASRVDVDKKKVLNLLREAQGISKGIVHDLLYTMLGTTMETFKDRLNKVGIVYIDKQKKFILKNNKCN